MPRRPRVFVDGAIYHVYCRFAHGARVFATPEDAFKRQVDAIDVELRRPLCMSCAISNLSTTPDLVPLTGARRYDLPSRSESMFPKSWMREICTFGSVEAGEGNLPGLPDTFLAQQWPGR